MKAASSTITTALAVAGLALTVSSGAMAAANASAPTHGQGRVTFVYVGYGKNDAHLKRASRYYPLELEFRLKGTPKDRPATDVRVQIKDAGDKMVLNVKSDGPLLLARLPTGTYSVTAEREGHKENRTIRVSPKKNERAIFEWNT